MSIYVWKIQNCNFEIWKFPKIKKVRFQKKSIGKKNRAQKVKNISKIKKIEISKKIISQKLTEITKDNKWNFRTKNSYQEIWVNHFKKIKHPKNFKLSKKLQILQKIETFLQKIQTKNTDFQIKSNFPNILTKFQNFEKLQSKNKFSKNCQISFQFQKIIKISKKSQ